MPLNAPSDSAVAAEAVAPSPVSRGAAAFALVVLFGMNLLNYVDRYVFFAVGQQVQRDLHLTDFRYGVLGVSFMLVYTFISPFIGWVGDRYSRRLFLAAGVGLWSIATVGTAFARDFNTMFFWRALLGVGEASYGIIAPTLLADLFPVHRRGRVMGIYYLALPVGGALGYVLGGWIGARHGWPNAFLVVGIPGLILAVLGGLITDPGRGASEGGHAARTIHRFSFDLLAIPSFRYNTLGMAAVTFATGAYAAWGATFYQRVRGMSQSQAGAWIGGMTATAGLVGIALGTWLADYLHRYTKRAYLLLGCVAVCTAVPFGLVGLLIPDFRLSLVLLFVAMVMMAVVLGPSNTVTANVVPANRRAAGYALSIFLIHLLGDISSPVLIGFVSDRLGRPAVTSSVIGRLLESLGAGAVPSPTGPTNLTVGMLSVVPVLALGALFFLIGSRHLPVDEARAAAAVDKDESARWS